MLYLDKFVLIKKDIPIILNKKIIKGLHYGGEKLVYERTKYIYKYFYIFNIKIKYVFSKTKPEVVVFLRPFKENWDRKNDRLSPNLWGKKEHPLTNIWCMMYKDYDNIRDNVYFKKVYRNQKVISILKKHPINFIIKSNLI
jgi:hypothetical protein